MRTSEYPYKWPQHVSYKVVTLYSAEEVSLLHVKVITCKPVISSMKSFLGTMSMSSASQDVNLVLLCRNT